MVDNKVILNYFSQEGGENAGLNFTSYKAGFSAAIAFFERQEALKKTVKNTVFDAMAFTCQKKDNRYFLTGVYHDSGCMIATNAHILCKIKASYPDSYEKKIIKYDRKTGINETIEGNFPSYWKVIPDDSDMTDFKALTIEDLKVIDSCSKVKSYDKLKNIKVNIVFPDIVNDKTGENLVLSENLHTLKCMLSFWKAFPDAVFSVHSNELENMELKNSVMLKKDNDNVSVFMPLCSTDSPDFIYNVKTKIITAAKK